MTPKPPLPEALWSRTPEDVREALAAVIQFYQARIEQLEARVAELEARLKSDSSNFHKPPSSDLAHAKPAPPKTADGKKPGGQPGHPKVERTRLAPDAVIDHTPRVCHAGHAPLAGSDESPRWHQVWELPAVRPHVTEHRFHTLACPCGHATAAPAPAGVPADGYGPRLKAAASYIILKQQSKTAGLARRNKVSFWDSRANQVKSFGHGSEKAKDANQANPRFDRPVLFRPGGEPGSA